MTSLRQLNVPAPHDSEIPWSTDGPRQTLRQRLRDVLLACDDDDRELALIGLLIESQADAEAVRLVLARALAVLQEQDQEIDRLRSRRINVATAA